MPERLLHDFKPRGMAGLVRLLEKTSGETWGD